MVSTADNKDNKTPLTDDPMKMAENFKRSFSREVEVYFVGAWSAFVSFLSYCFHSN